MEAAALVEQGELAVETPAGEIVETPTMETETDPDLEELNPGEEAVLEELAGGSATSETVEPEAAETEANAEPTGVESDTIIDSRSGAEDRVSKEPSDKEREG